MNPEQKRIYDFKERGIFYYDSFIIKLTNGQRNYIIKQVVQKKGIDERIYLDGNKYQGEDPLKLIEGLNVKPSRIRCTTLPIKPFKAPKALLKSGKVTE